MARLTAQEAAEKFARRASAASGDYAAGVQRVTEAPGAKAAKKATKWKAGIDKAAADKKWERNVGAVTLQDWQRSVAEKGQARYGGGVQAGAGKYAAFAQDFFPQQDAIVQRANAMPDDTVEQRIEKARFVMTETAKYKRNR